MANYAKILDLGFTLLAAGVERTQVVDYVRVKEEAGASPDEITDGLQQWAEDSGTATQDKINHAPE